MRVRLGSIPHSTLHRWLNCVSPATKTVMTVFICLILILWTSNHVPNTCPVARTFPSFAEMKNISSFSSKGRKLEEKKLKCFFPSKWRGRSEEGWRKKRRRMAQGICKFYDQTKANQSPEERGFPGSPAGRFMKFVQGWQVTAFGPCCALMRFGLWTLFRVSQEECNVCSLLINITKGFLTLQPPKLFLHLPIRWRRSWTNPHFDIEIFWKLIRANCLQIPD